MAALIQIKIKGWNLLPMPVREGVVTQLQRQDLPWQIANANDPAVRFGDIQMEVLLEGFVGWKEQVKVYLGALIYAFHQSYLTGDAACWEMAANLTPPPKTAPEKSKTVASGRDQPQPEKPTGRKKARWRKGLRVIDD